MLHVWSHLLCRRCDSSKCVPRLAHTLRVSSSLPALCPQVGRLAACMAAVGCYVGLRSLLAVDQLVRIFRKARAPAG